MSALTKAAEMAVQLLLDSTGDTVEVEYHPTMIDTMPHTIWLIRAAGTDPTQYIAKGTAHSPEQAEQQVQEKVRLLGVTITNVHNHRAASGPR